MKDTLNKATPPTPRRTRTHAIALSLVIAAVGAAGAVPAAADIAPLPADACNDGTRNAHRSVPHTNPAQTVNPGHKHLPRAPGGICVHTTSP